LAERYRVDPNRTFISGFSGGSRVAFRTAIAFPDVFAHTGHEVMNGNSLAEALGALDRPYPRDPVQHRRCLSSMEVRLQRARTDAAALIAQPPGARVQEQMDRLDREYGALLDAPVQHEK
jgi:hypothetical protein